MRAVLDPNVIISGLLSPSGNAARLLRAWERGEFELIVCAGLLAELECALAYPKLHHRVTESDAREVMQWLRQLGAFAADPDGAPPVRSADPGDDYLIALAASERAILVSGDRDLLDLAAEIPVFSPAEFHDRLADA